MYMNGLSPSILERPEVHVSGTKIPFLNDWLYRVSVDGVLKDEINSKVKWTPQQMLDVQRYYTESLTGYVFGGEQVKGWTPPTNPVIRKPVFKNRRRAIKAVNE